MKITASLLAIGISVFGIATPSIGQTPNTAAERPPEYLDPVENYLRIKKQDFEQSANGVRAIGAGGNFTSLYNLLKDKKSFDNKSVKGKDAAQQSRVRDALVQTVAYYLTSVGMTPSEVNRLTKAGYDPLASAERNISGQARFDDLLVIAEIPLVVDVTGIAVRDTSEILLNDITFTVANNIKKVKGIAETGSVSIPYSSFTSGIIQGSRCVFFLSNSVGKFRQGAGKRSTESELQQQELPYCLVGGSFQRLAPNPVETSLPQATVEQAIAKINAI